MLFSSLICFFKAGSKAPFDSLVSGVTPGSIGEFLGIIADLHFGGGLGHYRVSADQFLRAFDFEPHGTGMAGSRTEL